MRRPFARRAVKKFMPGEELSDALAAARGLAPEKVGAIVTRLGESLTGESQADAVRDHYLEAFDTISREALPVVVSVKPTQLGLDLSFDACLAHLETLAARAVQANSQLWIDMEDSSYVDRTLDLYRRVKSRFAPVGLALQAYLRRTPRDLEALMDVRPIIRLVKGAYAEPPQIAFPAKPDVDRAYLEIAERLLQAASRGAALPIFGTHDLGILQQLIATRSPARAGGHGLRDPHAVRDPHAGAAPARGRRACGALPDQLRRAVVPVVHASPGGAPRQRLVRGAQPADAIALRAPLDLKPASLHSRRRTSRRG